MYWSLSKQIQQMMRLASLDSLLAAPLLYAAIDLFNLGWVLTMLMQLASVSINCFIKTSVCILHVPQISWVINSSGCSITSSSCSCDFGWSIYRTKFKIRHEILAGRYIEQYSKYAIWLMDSSLKKLNCVIIYSLTLFLLCKMKKKNVSSVSLFFIQ